MSNQSTYSNAIENAISAAISNSRQKEAAAAKVTNSIKVLTDSIKTIRDKEIFPANSKLVETERLKNDLMVTLNAYKRTNPAPNDVLLLGYQAQIATYQKTMDAQKTLIANANVKIDGINKKITDIGGTKVTKVGTIPVGTNTTATKPSSTNGDNSAPKGEKIAFSQDYKYNAPMIKSAYFGTESLQSDVLDKNHVDRGNFQDAKQAWQGVQGGRGTIQMDRKFLSTFTSSTAGSSQTKFDLQKYGFKFLYNPTTVSMAWGLMSSMDPYFEAQQMDAFQVVSTALMSSTVTFELMLNRIADFDYINERGLKSALAPNTAAIDSNLDPAQRNRMYNTMYAATSPYGETVPIEDLQEIYRKGTMYDLEYLFKTINGPDGSFTSALNGTTADRGWMRPTIVELHLGNAMRYRVRVSNFAVNHIMFNNRMVPILSSVQLTCSRFNDGPESTTTVNSGGGSSSPASGLDNLRNTTPGYGQ